jgi:hypothetical protein
MFKDVIWISRLADLSLVLLGGWWETRSHYTAQARVELLFLRAHPPKCWDCRGVLPCPDRNFYWSWNFYKRKDYNKRSKGKLKVWILCILRDEDDDLLPYTCTPVVLDSIFHQKVIHT